MGFKRIPFKTRSVLRLNSQMPNRSCTGAIGCLDQRQLRCSADNNTASLQTSYSTYCVPTYHQTPFSTKHRFHRKNQCGGSHFYHAVGYEKKSFVKTEKKISSSQKEAHFRYQVGLRERKALYAKAAFRVENGEPPHQVPVTIDTSKARSNKYVVRQCLERLGWREFSFGKGDCDVYWTNEQFSYCTSDGVKIEGGKINKFPGMSEVLSKVNLGHCLNLFRSLFPEEYNFHPVTWFLPQQLPEFHDEVHRIQEKTQTKPVYIIKPDKSMSGTGICLISDPKEYTIIAEEKHTVEEYISNPLLIEHLKFDFRVYVVVTSLEPLKVYISKEGLARFCTLPYEKPTEKNIHESCMHLTNYTVNKTSKMYKHTESLDDGSKRTITSVFKNLRKMGMNTGQIWEEMKRAVVKTMIAVVPELRVMHRAALPPDKGGPSCFQILGFDFLLSETGIPYLLEVNARPGLRTDYEIKVAPGVSKHLDSPVDDKIKQPLIFETMMLITPPGKQTGPVIEGPRVLEQIYPAHFDVEYNELCLMDTVAEIFLDCLGDKGSSRMGLTEFKTFTRKCRLAAVGSGFTDNMLEILYNQMLQQWGHSGSDAGLCYQGFIEAFFHIAKKKYPSETILQSIKAMLGHFEKKSQQAIAES